MNDITLAERPPSRAARPSLADFARRQVLKRLADLREGHLVLREG